MVSGPRIVLVVGVLLLSSATTVPGLAATDGDAQPQTETDTETDVTTTIVVDLQRNGDARWTITKTFELSSRNETEAFDSLAEDFENGETDDLGLAAYQQAARQAADATGRSMTITNVSRSTSRSGTVTNGTGRLSISFTWSSFGRVETDRFYIDDVFTTDQGLWFEGLDESQRLVIRPPDGYEFFDAPIPVTLRNGTIQWTGPQKFDANTLSATFERTSAPPPGSQTPTATATATNTTGPSSSSAFLWVGLVTLGLSALAVVGYLLSQTGDVLDVPEWVDVTADDDATADDGTGTATTATAAATHESDDHGSDDTETDDAESDDDGIDVALLSDEERVERLLEQNGGRMKQANIVKETGWSNAKVSQLLSSMEEEGQIDKLRIGRENLISFPEEDVTDIEE